MTLKREMMTKASDLVYHARPIDPVVAASAGAPKALIGASLCHLVKCLIVIETRYAQAQPVKVMTKNPQQAGASTNAIASWKVMIAVSPSNPQDPHPPSPTGHHTRTATALGNSGACEPYNYGED